jgi:hypothetical protein
MLLLLLFVLQNFLFLPVTYESKNNHATSEKIQIYMIDVADKMFQLRYAPIFNAMSKYASDHGYKWLVIGDTVSEPYCEQKYKEFFFQKHCIISKWMEREAMIGDIIVVFDSDNVPYRTSMPLTPWFKHMEEDLIFYDRA